MGLSKKSWLMALLVLTAALYAAGETETLSPFESPADLTPEKQVDKLVFARLKELGIQPANLCSDAVFVRRVYLDVIGTLPTAQETKDFLADTNPDKRAALIDRLLERDEFADYWALKWSDLLRVKSEFPINLWPKAVYAYHRWVRTCIKENMPYDRFVREMLISSGSNFYVPQANFYRAIQSRQPQAIAQAVTLTFMGTRIENWPKDKQAGMAAFFSQVGYKYSAEWKEEIIFFDSDKAGGNASQAVFPDGTAIRLPPGKDPREVFADWLINTKNPWFSRNIVNRIWCWLLGRGIIHETDDIRPDNSPSNPKVLAYLEQELIKSHYDLKHIYRIILNSKTYQLSCIPRTDDPGGAANFAFYPLRRLEAEVLIDALCQVTGTTEKYFSATPEPFTFIPEDQRSIALADGSISSSFLEIFGRPARDTGMESERNNRTSASQKLHMLNSSHIQRKIEQGPRLQSLMKKGGDGREIVTELYLTILSRFPNEQELEIMKAYPKSGGLRGRETLLDITWVLLNSEEFIYRH